MSSYLPQNVKHNVSVYILLHWNLDLSFYKFVIPHCLAFFFVILKYIILVLYLGSFTFKLCNSEHKYSWLISSHQKMHSLFLKSKAALHSRLKLSGLCPHTSWSKLLCNGNCEQRIVCIIFKSSKKKKNFHKHMSYSHCKVLVCYLIRICICYLCERNHIPTEKFEMRKKKQSIEKRVWKDWNV